MCIEIFDQNLKEKVKGNNVLYCNGYFKKSNYFWAKGKLLPNDHAIFDSVHFVKYFLPNLLLIFTDSL